MWNWNNHKIIIILPFENSTTISRSAKKFQSPWKVWLNVKFAWKTTRIHHCSKIPISSFKFSRCEFYLYLFFTFSKTFNRLCKIIMFNFQTIPTFTLQKIFKEYLICTVVFGQFKKITTSKNIKRHLSLWNRKQKCLI